MKKRDLAILSAAVAAGVGLGVSNGTEAQAETTDNGTTTEAAAQPTVTKAAATQQQVDAAKQTADTSQQAANTAQAAVDAAKEKIGTTQKVVDEAKEAVKAATPEAIATAGEAVEEQKAANESAEGQLPKAVQEVTEAKSQTVAPNQELATAEKEKSAADQQVAEKQAAVDKAQNDVDGSSAATAQKNLAQATSEQKKATKTKDQAETEAKAADQAQKGASAEEAEATDANKTATAELTEAQQKADQAASAAKETQAKLDQVKSQVANKNAIAVTKDYVEALKQYNKVKYDSTTSDQEKAALSDQVKQAADKNLTMVPDYVSNAKDAQVKINSRADLTKDLFKELSLLGASLLKPVQAAFGDEAMGPVKVTDGSIKFSYDIAKNYEADKWDVSAEHGHDIPAINKAAAASGLRTHTIMNLYENWNGADVRSLEPGKPWGLTLDDFKKMVYNSAKVFLFQDEGSNWGHAVAVSGQMFADINGLNKDTNYYFGVSVDDFDAVDGYLGMPASLNSHVFGVHFVTLPETYIYENDKFDTQTNHEIPTNDAATLKAEAEKLSKTLATQQATAKKAEAALTAAQTKADQAAANLKQAQVAATAATANKTEADQALTKAQAAVTAADQGVAAAEKAVANASADSKTKAAALAQAKEDLAAAKEVQADKDKALEEKQQAVTAAEADVKAAEAQLARTQQAIEDGKVALQTKEDYYRSLVFAQQKLDNAEARHVDAQIEYWWALKALDKAKTTATADRVEYEKLLAALPKEQQKQAIEKALKAVEAKPAVTYLTNHAAKGTKLATVTPATAKRVSASVYPQTGSVDDSQKTVMGAALLSMLGILGFVSIGKHDRRYKKH